MLLADTCGGTIMTPAEFQHQFMFARRELAAGGTGVTTARSQYTVTRDDELSAAAAL